MQSKKQIDKKIQTKPNKTNVKLKAKQCKTNTNNNKENAKKSK